MNNTNWQCSGCGASTLWKNYKRHMRNCVRYQEVLAKQNYTQNKFTINNIISNDAKQIQTIYHQQLKSNIEYKYGIVQKSTLFKFLEKTILCTNCKKSVNVLRCFDIGPSFQVYLICTNPHCCYMFIFDSCDNVYNTN